MNILEQLERQQDFSNAETGIAEYILDNPDEIRTIGITELARRTYSSNAAIIRLCRKLGLNGYKEFRVAFAIDLEKQRQNTSDVEVNYPFISRESPESIMRSVANISKEAIETSYCSVPASRLDQAARMVRGANRIYIYAAGESCLNAMSFANMMLKIGYNTVMPTQYNETISITIGATSKDVALIVSYSGVILDSLKKELRVLKRSHVPIILISSQKSNEDVDLLISIPDKEHLIGKVAGYYSQTVIRYVLNCLYGIVYSLDLQKNRDYKDLGDSFNYSGQGNL